MPSNTGIPGFDFLLILISQASKKHCLLGLYRFHGRAPRWLRHMRHPREAEYPKEYIPPDSIGIDIYGLIKCPLEIIGILL